MIENDISLLTVDGYTIRRYRGMLGCHVDHGLGTMDATRVEYRDIVAWVKSMQAKGLAPKTIRNVRGLILASPETKAPNIIGRTRTTLRSSSSMSTLASVLTRPSNRLASHRCSDMSPVWSWPWLLSIAALAVAPSELSSPQMCAAAT